MLDTARKRILWYSGFGLLIVLTAFIARTEDNALRFSVVCYTSGDTPIYEGVSVGVVNGSSRYGFRFTDTDGQQMRIAANCVIQALPSEE